MTPTSLIREKPVRPVARSTQAVTQRPPILTRAELSPCTCPEHCERDHDDE